MKGVAVAAVVAIALCGAYVLTFFGPVYAVPIGASIRHDDFTFTVTGVSKKRVASGLHAYDVHVAVANEAKRVPYAWNDGIAYIRDERGARYDPVTRHDLTIAPGATANVALRFLLPDSVTHPALRFWDGVFMGDAFNGAAYAKAAINL